MQKAALTLRWQQNLFGRAVFGGVIATNGKSYCVCEAAVLPQHHPAVNQCIRHPSSGVKPAHHIVRSGSPDKG